MKLPSRRLINLAGFLACAGMMGFALYVEHFLYLMPCPLCVLQRLATITIGLLFLAAALQHPGRTGARIYAGLITVSVLAGMLVAGRHVWLQNMPADQVPECGPGFQYIMESLPFADALAKIFTGSGECADIAWSLLGLSMPAWVLVCFTALGATAIWNNIIRQS